MRLADSETLNTSAERVLEILDAYRDQPKESGYVYYVATNAAI